MFKPCAFFACLLMSLAPSLAADRVLFDFSNAAQSKAVKNLDSKAQVEQIGGNPALKITFGHERPYPNASLSPMNGKTWDLSAFKGIEIDVTNLDTESVKVGGRADNAGATGSKNSVGGAVTVEPGKTATLRIEFNRPFAMKLREQLKGMHYSPWGKRDPIGAVVDPSRIVAVQVYLLHPARDHQIAIDNVRAAGAFDPKSQHIPEPFFPFIDRYGQYMHQDWPGKIKSDADLTAQRQAEENAVESKPRPDQWDRYGGWANGPQLKATGHFRTEKVKGKWYLVDPDGRLFWSMGMDVVRAGGGTTPVSSDRAAWFADSPWKTEAFKPYLTEEKVTHGDYAKQTVPAFAFYSANLQRKYGADWYQQWLKVTPRRLMNWGFNTIGNWSEDKLLEKSAIPYTQWIYINSAKLPWQPGDHNRLSDPFHPMLRQELMRRGRRKLAKAANDPWCIGVFVDNELTWGDSRHLATGVVARGKSDQPAKIAMRDWLRQKYKSVDALNKAWGLSLKDFDGFLQSNTLPKTEAGQTDLEAFNEVIVRKYFQTVRDAIKEMAPNTLYLGCRFLAITNAQAVRAASEYADVVSMNIYRQSVGAWQPPANVDAPFIIGEFHFGATDHGVFGPGLVRADSSADRAALFTRYVESALDNPRLVGAHWFQMTDEPTTGRTQDGENHGIGFVTITDTPYAPMIEASRKVAAEMYQRRAK